MLVACIVVAMLVCGGASAYASYRIGVSVGTERAYRAVREMMYGGRRVADPMRIEKQLYKLMRESAE